VKRGRSSQVGKWAWFTSLANRVDIRILFIGSLLPDIIDKPVGRYIFSDIYGHGRIFAHTLLFFIVITVAGLLLYKYRRRIWLLTLASGTFMHLILDEIWYNPRTLFWPFLGFTFERSDLTDWLLNILHSLISDPAVYVSEAAGLAVLLWFGLALVRRKKLGVFIRYGQVG